MCQVCGAGRSQPGFRQVGANGKGKLGLTSHHPEPYRLIRFSLRLGYVLFPQVRAWEGTKPFRTKLAAPRKSRLRDPSLGRSGPSAPPAPNSAACCPLPRRAARQAAREQQ